MTTTSTNIDHSAPYARHSSAGGWFRRSEAWLDARGKAAWVAAMVLGFIVFWPVGLALLAYMIWSKRMFSGNCAAKRSRHSHLQAAMMPSGNSAFDAYKEDTLRRLEDEQHKFEEFLKRLRDAKDKAEFDQFMDDRANRRSSDESNADRAPRDDTRREN